MVCVHSLVGKKKFLLKFEDGQNKVIGYSLLMFLSSKKEVDMDEPISHLPEKQQGKLLTIIEDLEVGEP